MPDFLFSRNNRFGFNVSYQKFMKVARAVELMAKTELPGSRADARLLMSRRRIDRHVVTDRQQAEKARKSVPLDQFTKAVWDSISGVEVAITDPTKPKGEVFIIRVTWTWKQPERIYFHSLGAGDELAYQILERFDRESFMIEIGKGFNAALMIGTDSLSASFN